MEVRAPLGDRSKQFRNSGANPLVQTRGDCEFAKPHKRVVNVEQSQQQQQVHLTHGTRPQEQPTDLLGTSTPKKDGHVPFLTVAAPAAPAVKRAQTHEKELTKWQQTWRSILPSQHIYFEHDDSHDKDRKRAMLALKSLGAKIEPFFDENITIIVSRRPYDAKAQYPQGDIFRIVGKKQIKVWSIEKVFRFMRHLDADIPDYSSQTDAQLESLLQNERIFGTNDRDPLAKRDDIKYFVGPYLYVYDQTQRLRPVVVKEWRDAKECTKMNKSTNGKSLFVEESKSTLQANLVKRHRRRLQNLEECTEYRLQLEAACFPKDCPKLRRRSYTERVGYALDYLGQYYAKRPHEDPKVKYKGSGLEDFFENMARRSSPEVDTQETEDALDAQEELQCAPTEPAKDSEHPFQNVLDESPDAIDELNRHKRSMAPRKIDKVMFDVPVLPAPPAQLRRENSVFTPVVKEGNGQKVDQQQLLCNYGEIVASGVTQSGSNVNGGGLLSQGQNQGGNGLGPSRASATSRALIKDSQRTMVMPMGRVSIGKVGADTVVMHQGDSTIPNDTDVEMTDQVSVFRKTNKLMVTLRVPKEQLAKIKRQSPFIALKKRLEQEDLGLLGAPAVPAPAAPAALTSLPSKKKQEEKRREEMKPGYCENCRVKYTDFDAHCAGEGHRQFAQNSKNFAEIDRLIGKVSLRR